MMRPDVRQEIDRLFRVAVTLDGAERVAWVKKHAGSAEIRDGVLRLLIADEQGGAGDLLSPAALNAAQVLPAASGSDRNLDRQRLAKTERVSALDARVPSAIAPGDNTGQVEPLPEKVGPYRVLDSIGRRGGMGCVHQAVRQDGQFHYRVALKVIKRGTDTEEVLHRFDLERQILSALNHPNIARLYDGGALADGRPYFAMEWVDGLPVDDYCDRNNLTLRDRLRLFQKACAAVQHAHDNLIIHRDIKPSNILVTAQGEPKLVDFGIAKLLNPTLGDVAHATQLGQVVGTLAYMSPEQVRGDPLQTKTDVYSLGVLLFELLTGHRPYRVASTSRQEIERVICDENPDRPSTAITRTREVVDRDGRRTTLTPEVVAKRRAIDLNGLRSSLRGEIESILLKALQKAPGRRYSTAAAFAEDIQRYLERRPVEAQPDSFGYRLRSFARRNRGFAATAGLVAATLIGGIATTIWQRQVALRNERIAMDARIDAERTRDQLRAICSNLVSEFHDSLRGLDSATEARRVVAQTYLRAIGRIQPGDDGADVSPELIEAWLMAAEIADSRRNPIIGDRALATKYLALVDGALDRPSATLSDDQIFQFRLRWQRHDADLKLKSGDAENARRGFGAALQLIENRIAARGGDAELLRQKADALADIADCLEAKGDRDSLDEAARRRTESRAIREAAGGASQTSREARRARAAELWADTRSALRTQNPDLRKARDACEEILRITGDLHRLAPDSRTRRDLMLAHTRLGDVHCRQRVAADATTHADAARILLDEAKQLDPNDARLLADEMELWHLQLGAAELTRDNGAIRQFADLLKRRAQELLAQNRADPNAEFYFREAARALGESPE